MAAGFYFALTGPLSHVVHCVIAWQVDRYTLDMMAAPCVGTLSDINIGA